VVQDPPYLSPFAYLSVLGIGFVVRRGIYKRYGRRCVDPTGTNYLKEEILAECKKSIDPHIQIH